MPSKAAIIIPARLASTRLPQKLMLKSTGRPLITYAVDKAEEAKEKSNGFISEIIVATDSEEILEAVNEHSEKTGHSARAEMTRPDHQSGTDRIGEVAGRLSNDTEIIINVQGDEPDLPAETILMVGNLLNNNSQAAMSTAVRPIYDSKTFLDPNCVKCVMNENGFCLYFSRSPIPFDRDTSIEEGGRLGFLHLGIYGYRREVLLNYNKLPESELEKLEKLEQLRALSAGLKIIAGETLYTGTGIDTEEDYKEFVEKIGKV
jgi:3-deoxy-manno-octulosonate cytidylyltransferase (CMP-KDO synthetase)